MKFWSIKKGPILTAGRSAHLAWGWLLVVLVGLICWHFQGQVSQVLPWVVGVILALAYLSEVTSFITWKGDPFPFGDLVDVAAWLYGVANGIVTLRLLHLG